MAACAGRINRSTSELALHLVRHGQQVGVPLLGAATLALVAGFALLNQGLYETVGQDW